MAGKAGHAGEAWRHPQVPTPDAPDPEALGGSLDGVACHAACRAGFPHQLTLTLRAGAGPNKLWPWKPGRAQSHTQGKEWQLGPCACHPGPHTPGLGMATCQAVPGPSFTHAEQAPGKGRGGQRTRWTLFLFSAGH